MTLHRYVPILAHDAKEATGLLVLVYVWHDGAAAETLSSRARRMTQANWMPRASMVETAMAVTF